MNILPLFALLVLLFLAGCLGNTIPTVDESSLHISQGSYGYVLTWDWCSINELFPIECKVFDAQGSVEIAFIDTNLLHSYVAQSAASGRYEIYLPEGEYFPLKLYGDDPRKQCLLDANNCSDEELGYLASIVDTLKAENRFCVNMRLLSLQEVLLHDWYCLMKIDKNTIFNLNILESKESAQIVAKISPIAK